MEVTNEETRRNGWTRWMRWDGGAYLHEPPTVPPFPSPYFLPPYFLPPHPHPPYPDHPHHPRHPYAPLILVPPSSPEIFPILLLFQFQSIRRTGFLVPGCNRIACRGSLARSPGLDVRLMPCGCGCWCRCGLESSGHETRCGYGLDVVWLIGCG